MGGSGSKTDQSEDDLEQQGGGNSSRSSDDMQQSQWTDLGPASTVGGVAPSPPPAPAPTTPPLPPSTMSNALFPSSADNQIVAAQEQSGNLPPDTQGADDKKVTKVNGLLSRMKKANEALWWFIWNWIVGAPESFPWNAVPQRLVLEGPIVVVDGTRTVADERVGERCPPEKVGRTKDRRQRKLSILTLSLANICHVKKDTDKNDKTDEKDTCNDEDGLEKVCQDGKFEAWPFPKCTFKDWGYDDDFDLYRFKDDKENWQYEHLNDFHKLCAEAFEWIKEGNLDQAVACYIEAVKLTPSNDFEARLQAMAFCNLGIFLSSHLEVKSTHTYMKDDNTAVLLFKVGALVLKSPYCMYFYGHALAHGQGGAKDKDFNPRSIHYLNEAGKAGLGEAFYELGKIYEERGTRHGAVNVDMISAAEGFYDAALRAYTFDHKKNEKEKKKLGTTKLEKKIVNKNFITRHIPPSGAWEPSSVTVRSLLHTEGWDALEQSLSCDLGQRFCWAVAGQAFLFAGAIQLTQAGTDKVSEEAVPFLCILPTLGIILAVHSLFSTVEAFCRMQEQRDAVIKMVGKKLMAHGAILDASINDYYYHIQEDKLDNFAAWEKERAAFGVYVLRTYRLLFVASLTVRLAIIADLTFFISWICLARIWPTCTWPVDTSLCSAHPDCADLAGDCCPTFSGVFLDCCG